MRLTLLAAAVSIALAGCASLGQDVYDNRAKDECKEIMDLEQRRACEAEIDQKRWERDAARRGESKD
ncbi:MAG: hypothetical protein AAF719_06870 [Pseudomonadota bacterium]